MNHRKIVQAPVQAPGRGMINRIRAKAKSFGFKPQDVRPFRLRLMQALVSTSTSYTFQVNKGSGVEHVLEQRLEKSDAFWTYKIGLGIHRVLIELAGVIEQPGNSAVIHYPDEAWFVGGAAGLPAAAASEGQSLECLYNAKLFLRSDQDLRLQDFDCSYFRTVPHTQVDTTAVTGTTWGYDGEEMKDLSTNFGLWGNKRNEFEIKLAPGDISAIGGVASDSVNYAVIFVDGFQLVRGAESLTISDAAKLFG